MDNAEDHLYHVYITPQHSMWSVSKVLQLQITLT